MGLWPVTSPESENRQPKEVICYPAHGGIKKVRTFNKDTGGGYDGIFRKYLIAHSLRY